MKVSKDFSLAEFVPPAIYEHFVYKSIWFIDPKIVQMAQFIRDRFGKPITINNYLTGGSYQYSAFRDNACTIGAENSQHRHGRAIDFRIQGMSPMEIRADIIRNFEQYRASGLLCRFCPGHNGRRSNRTGRWQVQFERLIPVCG